MEELFAVTSASIRIPNIQAPVKKPDSTHRYFSFVQCCDESSTPLMSVDLGSRVNPTSVQLNRSFKLYSKLIYTIGY